MATVLSKSQVNKILMGVANDLAAGGASSPPSTTPPTPPVTGPSTVAKISTIFPTVNYNSIYTILYFLQQGRAVTDSQRFVLSNLALEMIKDPDKGEQALEIIKAAKV